jgi:hypothetical protein
MATMACNAAPWVEQIKQKYAVCVLGKRLVVEISSSH